jgi:hypothetical protein
VAPSPELEPVAVTLLLWRSSGRTGAALSRPVTPIVMPASDRGMETAWSLAYSWYPSALVSAEDR